MNPQDLGCLTLGRSDQRVELHTSADNRAATLAMLMQTQRSVTIFTRDLDAKILDNAQVVGAVKDFVLRSRQSRVRIITQDISKIVSQGHRLVNLYRRVPSYMDIRIPAKEHQSYNAAFLVFDHLGVIFRNHADRYEGTATFNDKINAQDLSNRFDDMWEASHGHPGLRVLSG